MSFYMKVRRFLVGPLVRLLCKFEIKGKENLPGGGGYIIAGNHLHGYDPVVVAVWFKTQIAFGAKIELFKFPVLGKIMYLIEQIPLDREGEDPRKTIQDLTAKAVAAMDKNWIFGLFPEGTRSPNGQLFLFKPGVTIIAHETGRIIVPYGIKYGWDGLRPKITLVFGEPLDPAKYTLLELKRLLRQKIAECSGQELANEFAKDYRKRIEKERADARAAAPRKRKFLSRR